MKRLSNRNNQFLIPSLFPNNRSEKMLSEIEFVVVDIETTGPPYHKIVEFAGIRMKNRQILDSYNTLINPQRNIHPVVAEFTGITPEMLKNAPTVDKVVHNILNFMSNFVIVAHNATFDFKMLNRLAIDSTNKELQNSLICTLKIARRLIPKVKSKSLDSLAEFFDITLPGRHRAYNDAIALVQIFLRFLDMLQEEGVRTLEDLMKFQHLTKRR